MLVLNRGGFTVTNPKPVPNYLGRYLLVIKKAINSANYIPYYSSPSFSLMVFSFSFIYLDQTWNLRTHSLSWHGFDLENSNGIAFLDERQSTKFNSAQADMLNGFDVTQKEIYVLTITIVLISH